MNDDLSALRAFRPVAIGPTAARTLHGRNALMHAIDTERPPHADPSRGARRRHGRRVVVVAAVLSIAAVGVAGAAGLIPDDVRRTLGLVGQGDPVFTPDVERAVKGGYAATPEGGTVEVWTAPTSGGGTCAYLRHLDANGTPRDPGGVECLVVRNDGAVPGPVSDAATVPGVPHRYAAIGGEGEPLTLRWQAPLGTARVVVTHADGTVSTATRDEDGWYVVAIASATGLESVTKVEALAASGDVLASTALLRRKPGATR